MGTRVWLWATMAGLVPGAVAYVVGAPAIAPWWPLLLVVPAAWITRPGPDARRGVWWLGTALCVASVLAGARARNLVDAGLGQDGWPTYDLADAPMPTSPPPYVAVDGFLRDAWVLGEYAVADGDVPDQSRPADAVLLPMTPTQDGTVRLQGALVVVRVRADAPRTQQRVTLRGRTEPLPREIVATLVDLAGGGSDGVVGVLVDTLHVPSPREAWTALAMFVGLAIGATAAFGLARRSAHASSRARAARAPARVRR